MDQRRPLNRSAVAAVAAVALGLPTRTAARGSEPERVLTVDLDQRGEAVNHDLVGFGVHDVGAPLTPIAALRPDRVRIDASLQEVSTGPDAPLQLHDLLARVAEIRAIGGEPLVILSYMPAWLGEPNALGRDPTRVAPADLDAWQALVHDVVLALATAPQPALRFEAWNEPDVPLFWQDTPTAWVDTVERSARAVAAVEAETGTDLAFGGPATVVPDPIYLVPFLTRFRDTSLPLDFVSWHYYGNYPFFGPDGTEFELTEPIQPVLGQQNPSRRLPTTAPRSGSSGSSPRRRWPARGARSRTSSSTSGTSPRPGSTTGTTPHRGAAFAAGVLVELQGAGLDAAAFFRANDTRGVPGEHGIVTLDGTPKPVWWTFAFWQDLAPTTVAIDPARAPTDDVWSMASRDDERVTVLLAAFDASGAAATSTSVGVRVVGAGADGVETATVRRISDTDALLETQAASFEEAAFVVEVPNPGVVFIDLPLRPSADSAGEPTTAGSAGTSTGRPSSFPATGPTWHPAAAAAAAAAAASLVLARLRRRLDSAPPAGGSSRDVPFGDPRR